MNNGYYILRVKNSNFAYYEEYKGIIKFCWDKDIRRYQRWDTLEEVRDYIQILKETHKFTADWEIVKVELNPVYKSVKITEGKDE